MWSILHLGGSALGAGLAGQGTPWPPPGPWQEILTRLSGLLVVTLGLAGKVRSWLLWAAVLAAAMTGSWQEASRRQARDAVRAPEPVAPADRVTCRGSAALRVTSWADTRPDGKWTAAAVILGGVFPDAPAGQRVPGRGEGARVKGSGAVPVPGQVILGKAVFRVPATGDLPGSFDYREFLAGRGLTWLADLEETSGAAKEAGPPGPGRHLARGRGWVLARLRALLPDREADLGAAVLLGARSGSSREGARPFARLGLAHLFAVSGLHVGLLLGVVAGPGRLAGLGPWLRLAPLLFLLPVYALLTGLPGSVVRAAGLGLLLAAANPCGRRPRGLHLLGLLFWISTLWQPAQVLDTGVRLSYLAAGGIVATMGLVNVSRERGKAAQWSVMALTVSLAAQWFTLPQTAISFGRFSLLAPLANLVAVPVFGAAVWLLLWALIADPLWGWMGQNLASLAWLLFRMLAAAAGWVASQSGGWNLGLAPAGPGLGLLWAFLTVAGLGLLRKGRAGGKSALVRGPLPVLLIWAGGHLILAGAGRALLDGGKVTAWQFDVGQGDCALVQFPDGWRCLIDTGGTWGRGTDQGPFLRSVVPFLERGWAREIPLVILSHGHLDHTGGNPAARRNLKVERWLAGGRAGRGLPGPAEPGPGENLHRWGPWSLDLAFPAGGYPEEFHENDLSLVVVLSFKNRPCMVWSGDLEEHGESYLLERGLVPGPVQVWKAGHHGSNTSGSQGWLNRLDPGLVILSCGVGNRYGHPNHGFYVVGGDTCEVARTDLEGSIRLEWDSRGALAWSTRSRKGQLQPLP